MVQGVRHQTRRQALRVAGGAGSHLVGARVDIPAIAPLAVAGIVRAALAAAGAIVRGPDAFMAGDSGHYQALAASIVREHRFATAAGAEVFRAPGYPAFLAILHSIYASSAFVIAVQVCLAVGTVALVMRMAGLLGGDRRTILAAGWCASLEPVLVFWMVKVMAETAWTLTLTGLVLVLVQYSSRQRAFLAVGAGVLLALQTYLKAAGYFLAPAVLLLIFALPRATFRCRLRHTMAAALTAAALLIPWHARNHRVTGYAGFSTLAERALYLSAGASVAAGQAHVPLASFREQRRTAVLAEFGSDAAAADAMRGRGFRELRSSPMAYARAHWAGMTRTVLDPGAVEYLRYAGAYPESGGALMRMSDHGTARVVADLWHERPGLIVLNLVFGVWLAAVLAAAARGLWRLPRRGAAILASIALYFVLISGGAHGSSRFRHPVMPLVAVMAAFGAAPAHRRRMTRGHTPAAVASSNATNRNEDSTA